MASALAKEKRPEDASEARERLPWERCDGESFAAFSRFVLYRNTDPGTRSMRKLGVSGTTAFRWAKRWQWTKRASAYDLWQLELSDGLANHNQTVHRSAVVRFSSAALSKATASVAKLNETKLSVDDVVNLAKSGVALERQALGLTDGETKIERSIGAAVNVSFNSPWLANQNQTEQNEKIVVSPGEKVLGETPGALAQTVSTKTVDKLPPRQLLPKPKRLAELIVPAPKAQVLSKGELAGPKAQTTGGNQ